MRIHVRVHGKLNTHRVFYNKLCLESRMENLRVSTLMTTLLTLKTEDLSLSAETKYTVAYSAQVSTISYEERKAEACS
jgi:hypothetical protein